MITQPGTVGFQKRKTAEIRILNGDALIAGTHLAPCLPVDLSDGNGFLSGEPMVMKAGGDLGAPVFTKASDLSKGTVCFAVEDFIGVGGVPTTVADASGLLQGISTLNAGTEIATAFFNTTVTYAPGDALTVKALVGTAPAGNAPVGGYVVDKASDGDVVIGYVTKGVIDSGTSVMVDSNPSKPYTDGQPLGTTTVSGADYTTGGNAVWVNDSLTTQMLQFAFGGAASKYVSVSASE